MGINLEVNEFNLWVVNVYYPTNCGTEELKRKFFSDPKARETYNKHQNNSNFDEKKIVSDPDCNNNGQRLKQFFKLKQLIFRPNSSNGYYTETHSITMIKEQKSRWFLLNWKIYVQQCTTNCRVYLGFEVETDHRLLMMATIYASTTKNGRKNSITQQHQKTVLTLKTPKQREPKLFTNKLNKLL